MTKSDKEELERNIFPIFDGVATKFHLRKGRQIKIISDLTGIIKDQKFQLYFSYSKVDIAHPR